MPASNREPLVDILLVEDSPDDADLMVEALKEGMLAHRVTHLEDGEQAIDHLRRAPTPDLILLDLHLPRATAMRCWKRSRTIRGCGAFRSSS